MAPELSFRRRLQQLAVAACSAAIRGVDEMRRANSIESVVVTVPKLLSLTAYRRSGPEDVCTGYRLQRGPYFNP